MSTKVNLLLRAQEKLYEVIDLLERACEGDGNAEAYLIDPLKIKVSGGHGFCSRDLNIDELIERYKDEDDGEEDGDNWYDEEEDGECPVQCPI